MTGLDLIRTDERHVIAHHRGLELVGAHCQVTEPTWVYLLGTTQ
jgi:hypothetical protein